MAYTNAGTENATEALPSSTQADQRPDGLPDLAIEELAEEPSSDTDSSREASAKEDEDPDVTFADRMRHLWLSKQGDEQLKAKRARKGVESGRLKRTHSQTVDEGHDGADSEAADDHDVAATARRLRRRIASPTSSVVSIYDGVGSRPGSRDERGTGKEAEWLHEAHQSSSLISEGSEQNVETMELD